MRVRVRALKPRFIVTLKSEAQLFNGREGSGAEAIFVQVDGTIYFTTCGE